MTHICWTEDFVLKKYNLDTALLSELQTVLPFLSSWNPPDVGSGYFSLSERGCFSGTVMLINPYKTSVVNGIIEVWASDGTNSPSLLFSNDSGYVNLESVLPVGTQFVLFRTLDRGSSGGTENYGWELMGKKGISHPYTEPTTAQGIAEMMARECGYTIA
jgi:hypothetical protein